MRKVQSKAGLAALMAVLVFGFALSADAWIVVTFQTPLGAYGDYGLGAYDSTDDLISDALVQVMWTPDATIGVLNQGVITPTGSDNDRILALATAPTDGSGYTVGTTDFFTSEYGQMTDIGVAYQFDTPSGVDQGDFIAGNVYLRVFDSGTPGMGSYYVSGSLTGVGDVWSGDLTWGEGGSPVAPNDRELLDMTSSQDIVMGTGDLTGVPIVPMGGQVVPEPTTIALFGLGLATLAMRRRRK